MDFRQLEAYVNVYELKSFSKAANGMFLSQPSISAYINSLEKELQTQLIHRSTKEFVPTKAGAMFYEYAKDMLSLRKKYVQLVKTSSNSSPGIIDICASSVPSQYILPEILGSFHKLYPDILFNVMEADSADVINSISSYQSEIGFVGAKIENTKCLYEEFISERLIIIAPNEKRFLNSGAEETLNLLKNEFFITRELGSGTRLMFEKFLKNIGIEPETLKVSAQLNNTQSIIRAVANGLGISIVSEIAAKSYIQKKMIISIEAPFFLKRNFYIVLKKNRIQTPIIDIFLKFSKSYSEKAAFNS